MLYMKRITHFQNCLCCVAQTLIKSFFAFLVFHVVLYTITTLCMSHTLIKSHLTFPQLHDFVFSHNFESPA